MESAWKSFSTRMEFSIELLLEDALFPAYVHWFLVVDAELTAYSAKKHGGTYSAEERISTLVLAKG